MVRPNILCVGYEPRLLETRSMILRQAGYVVHEASILAVALSKMESDFIDGLLICNSIPRKQQEWFVTQVTNKRRLLPILCIKSHPYDQGVRGCTRVNGEPESLLTAIGAYARKYEAEPFRVMQRLVDASDNSRRLKARMS